MDPLAKLAKRASDLSRRSALSAVLPPRFSSWLVDRVRSQYLRRASAVGGTGGVPDRPAGGRPGGVRAAPLVVLGVSYSFIEQASPPKGVCSLNFSLPPNAESAGHRIFPGASIVVDSAINFGCVTGRFWGWSELIPRGGVHWTRCRKERASVWLPLPLKSRFRTCWRASGARLIRSEGRGDRCGNRFYGAGGWVSLGGRLA